MAGGFHACLGFLQLREVDDLVDLRLDASGGDMGQHLRDEPRHGGRSLLLGAQLVGDAEQREPLGMQGLEVDVGVQHAIDIAHRGEPALEGQRADVLGEHGAADGVDDEVDAMLLGGLPSPRREVGGARAQADVEAERLEHAPACRAEPEVPMTFAPSALASCSEATPTPDDTPLISSHSPALRRPCSTSMS